MKKIIGIFSAVAIILSSCSSNNDVMLEGMTFKTVQVEFKSSLEGKGLKFPIVVDPNPSKVDTLEIPIKVKSSSAREINYILTCTDKSVEPIKGTTLENESLILDLPANKTFNAKFCYSEYMDGNIAYIENDKVFEHNRVFTTENSIISPVELTRYIGSFTAKAGKIPVNSTVKLAITHPNAFYWETLNVLDTIKTHNVELSEQESYEMFGAPGREGVINVSVELWKNGKKIKGGNYLYSLTRNVRKTVTYNINHINEEGEDLTEFSDITVTVNEEWSDLTDDSNQQIGK